MTSPNSQITFRYVSLAHNLIRAVLKSTRPGTDTAYVLPTEKSRQMALREFQKTWQFTQTLFITMEEFKEQLFRSELPVLKEEKRTLALFQALTKEEKSFFNIHNYFQSIRFAQNFFDLWQEFNEEQVGQITRLSRQNLAGSGIHEWQIETFEKMRQVKEHYFNFIRRRGFNDPIFLVKPENYDSSLFSSFRRFVFVNQFYYTGLEKNIIKRLLADKRQVHIYYQLPSCLVDEETLEVKNFTFKSLGRSRLQKLEIVESPNDFAMLASFLSELKPGLTVFDADNSRSAWDNLLSFRHFDLGTARLLRKTFLYDFFAIIYSLCNQSLFEPKRKKRLYPLQSILAAVRDDRFYRIVLQKTSAAYSPREILLDEIYQLLENGFRYVDQELELFRYARAPRLHHLMKGLLAILNNFQSLSTPRHLVDIIDRRDGIQINTLLTEKEQKLSNIQQVFYQALSDFASFEELSIVDDWSGLVGQQPEQSRFACSLGIQRLFLEYLKSRRFQYHSVAPQNNRVRFTALLDSRNIQADSIAVLNVVEGKLPRTRKTPFLFTDTQRAALGLKTYEDIILREKYYFFRLLLNARSATIYTQKNIERNVEPSSFLEEIKLSRMDGSYAMRCPGDISYHNLYFHLFKPDRGYQVDQQQSRHPEFFRIPLQKAGDFPGDQLLTSYYGLSQLLKNPFAYYIKYMAGLRQIEIQVPTAFTRQLIGNIVHEALNKTWILFEEKCAAPTFGYDFSRATTDLINKACRFAVEKKGKYYYQIPHNYSFVYFCRFVIPLIVDGISFFFRMLQASHLQGRRLKVIPESEFSLAEERTAKTVVTKQENRLGIAVNIRGRADLRIEDISGGRKYIYDYKTGSMDKEQLLFYELFYYLLEEAASASSVNSYFFNFFDLRIKSLQSFYRTKMDKRQMVQHFREQIILALNVLAERGFALPDKRTQMRTMAEISRVDLYLTQSKEKW